MNDYIQRITAMSDEEAKECLLNLVEAAIEHPDEISDILCDWGLTEEE